MLSDIKIRNSKPREKTYKIYDTRGLYMIVTPTGRRWWRFKFRFGGKERGICFGVYPDVPPHGSPTGSLGAGSAASTGGVIRGRADSSTLIEPEAIGTLHFR
jgi:Arm DNA-binding domain